MSGRFANVYHLPVFHGKTPQHKLYNYPLRETKAKDEIMLDQLNADLARPASPFTRKVEASFIIMWPSPMLLIQQECMLEDILELIAEREAQILAERRAEKPAERRLHRVSAKARTKTTAKAPKQTAKTTEVPK